MMIKRNINVLSKNVKVWQVFIKLQAFDTRTSTNTKEKGEQNVPNSNLR